MIGWYATSYDPSKASIRLRLLQPMKHLQEKGVGTELYDPKKGVGAYEAIIFSKSVQPATLTLARAAKAAGTLVIFDLCDNIFEAKESPTKRRKVDRLRELLSLADAVTFATAGLQEQIVRRVPTIGGQQFIVPDMLEDLEGASYPISLAQRFFMRRLASFHAANAGALRCVWFGNCQGKKSGLAHVQGAVHELENFSRTHKVALTIIGDERARYWEASRKWRIPHFYLPWSLGTFWPAMKRHDVAIVPVERNDYTIGKTINRPATALRAGLGVIADSIPAYEELRPFIVLDDWQEGLHRYRMQDPRDEQGCEAARQHIAASYGSAVVGDHWLKVVRQISRAHDDRLAAA